MHKARKRAAARNPSSRDSRCGPSPSPPGTPPPETQAAAVAKKPWEVENPFSKGSDERAAHEKMMIRQWGDRYKTFKRERRAAKKAAKLVARASRKTAGPCETAGAGAHAPEQVTLGRGVAAHVSRRL